MNKWTVAAAVAVWLPAAAGHCADKQKKTESEIHASGSGEVAVNPDKAKVMASCEAASEAGATSEADKKAVMEKYNACASGVSDLAGDGEKGAIGDKKPQVIPNSVELVHQYDRQSGQKIEGKSYWKMAGTIQATAQHHDIGSLQDKLASFYEGVNKTDGARVVSVRAGLSESRREEAEGKALVLAHAASRRRAETLISAEKQYVKNVALQPLPKKSVIEPPSPGWYARESSPRSMAKAAMPMSADPEMKPTVALAPLSVSMSVTNEWSRKFDDASAAFAKRVINFGKKSWN